MSQAFCVLTVSGLGGLVGMFIRWSQNGLRRGAEEQLYASRHAPPPKTRPDSSDL